ncbi:MAG TPA: DUF5063 domain-containing protein [Tetrasphaera sp.]|uniref:DUF5063 domain-containing protein n=1 Tax=Nostocoides vanveenii TaxID=330835 RepID=A0ABN2L7E0_9MICO|nr:DUF5063 domain-containing protein [Tetrasphaera sp.]HNQ07045.1 DUF5063 domain-containing protein [Tetrasphaera sp.]
MPDRTDAIDTSVTDTDAPDTADLAQLAEISALEARAFLDTMTEIASGTSPEAALSLALLATSQVLVTGARLGAVQDVVLRERFEPDDGPDTDVDALQSAILNVFEGLDTYADLVDPVTTHELTTGSLSADFAAVVAALDHGLRHYDRGNRIEALWWWQFSYLSDWGERAAMALRVLHSLLAHVRLDADEDIVAEAEFDALHP